MKAVYKLFIFILLFVLLLEMTHLDVGKYQWILRLSISFIIFLESSMVLMIIIKRPSIKNWIKNTFLVCYTFLFIFLSLEAVFMLIGKSHAVGYTLNSKVWFYKYWGAVNKDGYRDLEINPKRKKTILAVGDSFTAGHGTKYQKDRYTNVLESMLNEKKMEAQVLNLGANGSDTKDEYSRMIKYTTENNITPDFITLQYYGNDIEGAAKESGAAFTGFQIYPNLNDLEKFVMKGSYLVNYLYWLSPRADTEPYTKFLKNSYSNDSIFAKNLRDLKLFSEYSKSKNTPFLVVIFPFLFDIKMSREVYIDKLTLFLKKEGINYIDLSGMIEKFSIQERIVNDNDCHPSDLIQSLTAKAINEWMEKNSVGL